MDFSLGDKERALIRDIAEFTHKELPTDYRSPTLIDQECQDFEFEISIAKKLAQKGWLVMSWPKEYGGGGATEIEKTVYEMEIDYWSIPGAWVGIREVQWVGPCLILFGTEEQKKRYIPLIASGDRDGV